MAAKPLLRSLLAVSTSLVAFPALAANFTITNGTTATTTQSIGAGASQTGTVDAGGAINTANDPAIDSTSVGGTITNNGTITSTAGGANVILINATNNTATNNGSITSSTNASSAFRITADTATIANTGTITMNGIGSVGILSITNNNTLTNSGTISMNNASANGIFVIGNTNTFTNTGTVSTSGANTHAIYGDGNGGTFINNGLVTTSGSSAYGLYADGLNNTFINNGTIITNGTNADGMLNDTASSNTFINNGLILATGAATEGMNSVDNATITNNGRIIADSTGNAIRGFGDNNVITNNGYVHSTNGITVEMVGNNNTLNLGTNSIVDGTVVYGGAGGALNYNIANAGPGGSVAAITGTVTGTHTTTVTYTGTMPKGARLIQGNNTVAVITPDNFASTNQLVTQTLEDTGTIINRRQQLALLGDTTEIASGTQYAASTATLNDSASTSGWAVRDRKILWAEGFGSYQQRATDGNAAESRARSGGILGVMDLPQTDSGLRAGLYAGVFTGDLNIGAVSFREINSHGVLAGGYLGTSYGAYYLSAQLATGYSRNDSDRNTGVDIANADYNSFFLSPSLTVMRPVNTSGIIWVPSVTLRYTTQLDGSYSEEGSVANQNVASRTSHALDARAMLEAHLDEKRFVGGTFKPSLRAGLAGQTRIGTNTADVRTLGNSLTFHPEGGDNYVDGILGANITHALASGPQLYADAEANLGLNKGGPGHNKGLTGRAGARWKF